MIQEPEILLKVEKKIDLKKKKKFHMVDKEGIQR